ncbi:MAG: hypothetical protein RLZZ513_203, partial [Pseudomonadota bacterium]
VAECFSIEQEAAGIQSVYARLQ